MLTGQDNKQMHNYCYMCTLHIYITLSFFCRFLFHQPIFHGHHWFGQLLHMSNSVNATK